MDQREKISEILSSFRKVNKYLYRQMWHHANELGVTVVQLRFLKIISDCPDISLLEVTDKMEMSKSTASSVVDRLVKAGLVKREKSKTDRRAVVLRLTALGEEKEKEGYALFHQRMERLHELSEQDVRKLLHLHDQIAEKITVDGDDNFER
ncbi:MarR family winged helix-turn-helix transcriptional regulator [Virgibacillus kimchii]